MDSEKNNSSLENSRSGLTETDVNLSSGAKHKPNCIGNDAGQSEQLPYHHAGPEGHRWQAAADGHYRLAVEKNEECVEHW